LTKLNPQILKRDGKPSFVVLTYEEFLALSEELADLRDSRAIRDAAKADAGKKRLSLEQTRTALPARAKRSAAA
jgi:PHD/YefM family antitoxin component YafN of YafNO toxin-antitoxin module